eukprot:3109938-Pyramimonas_sp.AAC.1
MGPPKSCIWTVPTVAGQRPLLLAEIATTRATWGVANKIATKLYHIVPAFTKTKADIEIRNGSQQEDVATTTPYT